MELLRNLDLEAAIIEAPEDLGARMVYGDWLAVQGDPRGPWFALSAAVEAAPLDVRLRSAATEMFHEHGALFLGDGVLLRPNAWFGWLGGFLDEVRLQTFALAKRSIHAASSLFHHPHARFLRHVGLGNLGKPLEILDALIAADLPLLEGATLIDAPYVDQLVGIDVLLERYPLKRLGARSVTWTRVLPHLRELHLELHGTSLAWLGRTLPDLAQLTLDCQRVSPAPIDIARLVADLPIHTLRVIHHDNPEAVIGALTPPPPHLRRIDLSHSSLADVGALARWPIDVELVAIRTQITPTTEERLKAAGRKVEITRPALDWSNLGGDLGEDTWWVHRAKLGDRAGLALVPDGGRQLFESATRNWSSERYDVDVMDVCVTLPSARWHAWPWAAAASARSWKKQYALSEAIAREGLMREPREPNFYAFVTYGLRRQGLLTEAVAEIPRAEAALEQPPSDAQATGGPLCLIDCMFTLTLTGDYAAALALADRLPALDDANLQAMRAMCHAAAGDPILARVAFDRAGRRASAPAYVEEPARRAVYDHATAVIALLPKPRTTQPLPTVEVELDAYGPSAGATEWTLSEVDFDAAMTALERAWPVYPERNWFKTDRNLAALHQHPRFLAMIG